MASDSSDQFSGIGREGEIKGLLQPFIGEVAESPPTTMKERPIEGDGGMRMEL
jgi:hypothetical protein